MKFFEWSTVVSECFSKNYKIKKVNFDGILNSGVKFYVVIYFSAMAHLNIDDHDESNTLLLFLTVVVIIIIGRRGEWKFDALTVLVHKVVK